MTMCFNGKKFQCLNPLPVTIIKPNGKNLNWVVFFEVILVAPLV